MGLCASSFERKKGSRRDGDRETAAAAAAAAGRGITDSTLIKVIYVDGKLQELKRPMKARDITSQNPNCFLCSSESMSIGVPVPQLDDEEELQASQIYFLLPSSHVQIPLSLPDLCALAIKASSALGEDGVGFVSSGSSKLMSYVGD